VYSETVAEPQSFKPTLGCRGKETVVTLEEALKIVKERYGLRNGYVTADGVMMYVASAEEELSLIPEVKLPEYGIALLAPEVVELARGAISIEALARRKNPELFCI
jgi:hypothetical protein